MAAPAVSFIVAAPPQLPPPGSNQQQQEMGGSGTTTCAGPFEACVWGDFFITYVPPPTQRSEEWMIERVQQLKEQVRRVFEAAMVKGTASTATLVDTLERLGIDNHFRHEMALALSHIHADEDKLLQSGGDDLHSVALCFRLLRQHGFLVSADVFEQFKDGTGSFRQGVSNNVRGLLTLYNAAHMAYPGEEGLDEDIAFARSHLEAAAKQGKLMSPMAEQVNRALGIPLPRFLQRLEAMHYVAEYGQEDGHDAVILELARLDYTLVKSLHLKELKELTYWWRDLYDNVKLTYSRDRIVEMYFWALGVYHTVEYSLGRILLTKVIALTTLMDDTYDVYATYEDSQKFNEAIQRWDESAVSILPEYLRILYMKTLSNFKEFEDILEPDEKYRVSYVQKAYKALSKYYLQEAKWSSENHMPSFKEHMDLTAVSTALPMLSLASLMGAGQVHATKKTLEWGLREPDMFRACGEIGRLLNDIASFKKGKNKKDVASSMECYLKEHGATGEEAAAAFAAMTEHAWRRINWSCMEIDPVLLPAAQQVVVNLARTCEIIYYGGRDAYTFGVDLRDLVTSLFLTPGPA